MKRDRPREAMLRGRYLFTASIFDYLDRIGFGKGNEIQLTDAMNLMASEQSVQALHWNAKRYDIGNKADDLRCFLDFAAKHPETQDELRRYLAESASA